MTKIEDSRLVIRAPQLLHQIVNAVCATNKWEQNQHRDQHKKPVTLNEVKGLATVGAEVLRFAQNDISGSTRENAGHRTLS